MTSVYLLAPAEADLREARRHYNGVSPALGDAFLLHVEAALEMMSLHPELYQLAFDEVRRVPLHRFPYTIFYRMRAASIEVVGILHAHRHPAHAESRG